MGSWGCFGVPKHGSSPARLGSLLSMSEASDSHPGLYESVISAFRAPGTPNEAAGANHGSYISTQSRWPQSMHERRPSRFRRDLTPLVGPGGFVRRARRTKRTNYRLIEPRIAVGDPGGRKLWP